MKTLPVAIIASGLLLGACAGKENVSKQIESLEHSASDWDASQTEKAIDIYLKGLEKQRALLPENMEVVEMTGFFLRSRCDAEVLDRRSAEIEEAEKALDEARAKLINDE